MDDKEFPLPRKPKPKEKEIEEIIIDIIAKELCINENEINEINLESRIAQDLGADSLDMVELLMALEEKFDITIPDEEVEKMVTVSDVVKYIEANRPVGPGSPPSPPNRLLDMSKPSPKGPPKCEMNWPYPEGPDPEQAFCYPSPAGPPIPKKMTL